MQEMNLERAVDQTMWGLNTGILAWISFQTKWEMIVWILSGGVIRSDSVIEKDHTGVVEDKQERSSRSRGTDQEGIAVVQVINDGDFGQGVRCGAIEYF